MIEDCHIESGVIIYHPDLSNLYGCFIGAGVTVGPFVEIQRGAVIGSHSKICSHTFICERVRIGERVFVGHGVMFMNDLLPMIGVAPVWAETVIEDGVSIGSGAIILPVRIGECAIVGAGAVVTRNVPALSIVAGNPARVMRQFESVEARNAFAERYSFNAGA